MTQLKVSVIIPVLNLKRFLQKAVESVLNQKEIGEIILVVDGSSDAMEICKRLESSHEIVRVLHPPKNEKPGTAAYFNLGITQSRFDYVAFLEADDWYLPNRFKKDEEVFRKHSNADVVFSSVQWGQNNTQPLLNAKIGDPRENIGVNAVPKEFYKYVLLVKQRHPEFHTSSITIKKSFLLKDKLFDERLHLHEDSELWRRLLRRGSFFAGELLRPVAVVGEHEKKRINTKTDNTRLRMYAAFFENVKINNMYGFEKAYHIKEILRIQSKNFSNNWKRRSWFYFSLIRARVNTKSYLEKHRSSYISTFIE